MVIGELPLSSSVYFPYNKIGKSIGWGLEFSNDEICLSNGTGLG